MDRKRTIILAGGVGGGVLVIAVAVAMVAALVNSVSELSENSGSENAKLQFSVVQEQEEEHSTALPADDFERRTATYAAGEKRLEEEQSSRYVSSTSFGSGFKRREAQAPAAAESAPAAAVVPVKPAAPTRTKGRAKAKPQPVEAPQPQPQGIRTKRTRYADAEAPAAAARQAQAQMPLREGKASFRAKVFEDVEVVNSAYVKIRVLQDFEYDGCTIKRNTMLTAEARRGSRSVDILLYSLMACGRRINTNFTAYSLDGIQGLPVREDKAAEVGAKEGRDEAVSGAVSGVANRATGLVGIVGDAVAAGVSGGVRASQQVQPVLVEEGRELIFMMN